MILGDNGLGKTTLLQLLASLDKKGPLIFQKKTEVNKYIAVSKNDDSQFLTNNIAFIKVDVCVNNEKHELNFSFTNGDAGTFITYFPIRIFGYGANRFMSSTSLTDSKSENSATLFNDDAKLINAEEWLLQLDYSASKPSQIQEFAQKKRDQVKEILIELLPDITDIRFTEPTKENLKSNIEFLTSFGWVRIHELSLGYKTMVAWMVDLAARMFERYPESDNPLAEPAIVLVDEIDLHLHPKWQRKIFDYLTEQFPQTQFVVTAHSPLVVQSAPKDANIVVLRKEGDHVVIDNNNESVQSWRLDQIMSSDLFGIESARGPETEKWMEERKALLQKTTLTPEEQERLKVLNEQAYTLPTADDAEDREAMDIIRKAAGYLKNKIGVE